MYFKPEIYRALELNCILNVELDTKKEHIREGMKLKYSQNSDLLELLRLTGSNQLGEANPFDGYWGIGARISSDSAFDINTWKDNWTGHLLMEVRDELC